MLNTMVDYINFNVIKDNIKLSHHYYKDNNKVPLFTDAYCTEYPDLLKILEDTFNKKMVLLVNDQFLSVDQQICLIYSFIKNKFISDNILNTIISYNIFIEWCYEIYSNGKNLILLGDTCYVSNKITEEIKVDNIIDVKLREEVTKFLLNNKYLSDNIQRLFTDLYLVLITKNVGIRIKILCLFVLINIYKSFYCFNIRTLSNDLIGSLKDIDGISFGFYKDILIRLNIDKDKINLQYLHYYYFQKFDKLKMISILGTLKSRINNQSDNAFISIYFDYRASEFYKKHALKNNIYYDVDKDTKLVNISMVKFIKLNIDYELYRDSIFIELSKIHEDNTQDRIKINNKFAEATSIFIQNVNNLDFTLRNIIQDEYFNNVNTSLQKLHKESIQNLNEFNNLTVNSPIFSLSEFDNGRVFDPNNLINIIEIVGNAIRQNNLINRNFVFSINNDINNLNDEIFTNVDNLEQTIQETNQLNNNLNRVLNEEFNTELNVNNNIIEEEIEDNNSISNLNNSKKITDEILINTAIDNDREVVHDHKVMNSVVELIKAVSPSIHNKTIDDIIKELDELPIEKHKGVKICTGILKSMTKQSENLFVYDFIDGGLKVIDAIKLVYMRVDNQVLINAVLSCLTNLYLVIEKSMEIELYGVINEVKNTMIEDEILNLIYRCDHIEVDFSLCCATGQFTKILSTIEGNTIKLSNGEDYVVPYLSSDTTLKNEILFMLSKMVNDYETIDELYKNAIPIVKSKYNHIESKIIDDIFDSFKF